MPELLACMQKAHLSSTFTTDNDFAGPNVECRLHGVEVIVVYPVADLTRKTEKARVDLVSRDAISIISDNDPTACRTKSQKDLHRFTVHDQDQSW
jgi:phosphatidate phosphatase APP1